MVFIWFLSECLLEGISNRLCSTFIENKKNNVKREHVYSKKKVTMILETDDQANCNLTHSVRNT